MRITVIVGVTPFEEIAVKQLLIVILGALCWVNTVSAELIRYVDEVGRAHYVDSTERVPEQYRANAVRGVGRAVSRTTGGSDYQPTGRVSREVTIYVTKWCPYCRKLESFLKENNVSYRRYDVEQDPIGRKRYAELGRSGIPITDIGGRIYRGFSESEFRRALGMEEK